MTSPEELFAAKVRCEDGHWLWTAALTGKGRYGCFWYLGRPEQAHRASYKMFVGLLEDTDELHHKCRIKQCVAPWHLEKTTHQGNMAHERKEFCKNGHEIAVVGRNKSGNCKQCMREYLQDYYQNVTKPKLLGDKRVGKHRAHMSVIGRIKWWANKQLPARKSHDADVLVLAGCLYLGLPVFVILGAISITMTATQKG